MSIPLPNLDDRRFEDLVEELRTQIPRYASKWKDHNFSDPGITLMEMLAWLTEMTLYRLNQEPHEKPPDKPPEEPHRVYQKFLTLIEEKKNGETIGDAEKGKAVDNLWKPYRAITAADFERLAVEANPERTVRAKCMINRNLDETTRDETGHISVLVVPGSEEERPVPDSDLKKKILKYLISRRLITTRVHVVAPEYLDISIPFQVTAKENIDQASLDERVKERLRSFLHPISGGIDGNGWPFGRDVVISEIYRIIEETPGVDYTDEAGLIPSAQFIYLYFNAIEFEQSLPSGAYMEVKNGRTRFPIAEAGGREEIDYLMIKGFKQGDRVKVTHLDDPYYRKWLTVKSVSVSIDNWKELVFDVFQVPKGFPPGSIISSEDGRISAILSHDIPVNQEVTTLEITGFQKGDIIDIKRADGTVIIENIEFTRVERCTDRVLLEENWLPWYVQGSA